MSEPTRQEVIDAYEMLDVLLGYAEDHNPDLVPVRRRIIEKALPPRPPLTMADVVWDEDKCFLAEAEHPEYGKVVMLKKDTFDGNITVLYKDEDGFKDILCTNPKYLTPTDTKYALLEM